MQNIVSHPDTPLFRLRAHWLWQVSQSLVSNRGLLRDSPRPGNPPYGPGHAKTCLMPYANNKGADQPAHPRSLISTFVVRCLDSMICILALSKDWGFYLASVAEQASLSLPWSQTPKTGFLVTWFNYDPGKSDVAFYSPHTVSKQPSLISLRCAFNGQLRTQDFFMRTAKTLIRLGGCPGWSERTLSLLVLSCRGSNYSTMFRKLRISNSVLI